MNSFSNYINKRNEWISCQINILGRLAVKTVQAQCGAFESHMHHLIRHSAAATILCCQSCHDLSTICSDVWKQHKAATSQRLCWSGYACLTLDWPQKSQMEGDNASGSMYVGMSRSELSKGMHGDDSLCCTHRWCWLLINTLLMRYASIVASDCACDVDWLHRLAKWVFVLSLLSICALFTIVFDWLCPGRFDVVEIMHWVFLCKLAAVDGCLALTWLLWDKTRCQYGLTHVMTVFCCLGCYWGATCYTWAQSHTAVPTGSPSHPNIFFIF